MVNLQHELSYTTDFRKLDYLLEADSSQQKSKNQKSDWNTKNYDGSQLLWRRANTRNVGFEILETVKLPCYTLPPTRQYSSFRNLPP